MHVGTGFFVRMPDGAVFLVSAAHVLDKPVFEKTGLFYFATDPKTGLLSARLVTGTIRSPAPPEGKTRKEDTFDVAAVPVRDNPPPYPSLGIDVLPFERLAPHALPREGKAYKVVGIPSSKFKVNKPAGRVAPMICGLDTLPLPESSYERLGFSPRHNLLLHCDKEKLYELRGHNPRPLDNPHGMSGSPVF